MRKKLTSLAIILTAVCAIVFLASSFSETMAQDQSEPDEVECPPDQCFAAPTVDDEKNQQEGTDGTCLCSSIYDFDCHYEYISAFDCIPWWHEDNDPGAEEWECDYSSNDWGLKKYDSNSGSLELICPIPTSSGVNNITYWGNVGHIAGYVYHYNSSYTSNLYVYSASQTGSYSYQGSIPNSSSGQQTLNVTPQGTKYYYWYALVYLANHPSSSFHGLRVCYDPE